MNGCGYQAHFLYQAFFTCDLNIIINIEWPINQDHSARSKVRERILECKADNKTGNTESGQHGSKRNPHLTQGEQNPYAHRRGADRSDQRIAMQLGQRGGCSAKCRVCGAASQATQPARDKEDQQNHKRIENDVGRV